ncbi:MAG: DUF6519 domain-containing protein [bacterium]
MHGDFSRNTFDPFKYFSRVLMQQGRVQLDANWNEQVSILLHYLQSLAADLIGSYGGPQDLLDTNNKISKENCGFKLVVKNNLDDFATSFPDRSKLAESLNKDQSKMIIGKGHYYVDGILCEVDNYFDYTDQPYYPLADSEKLDTFKDGLSRLVYLDVWERHITYLEDEDGNNPSIREVALGGPDTATRAKVVWQVKTTNKMPDNQNAINLPANESDWRAWINKNWPAWVENWQSINRGQLKAKGKEDPENNTDPCILSPEARYRGAENQLYRVEIHKDGKGSDATFKWSRQNGSVVFPIRELSGMRATLEHLGRDERFGLKVGDWVEVVDDHYVLRNCAEPLWQVDTIDPVNVVVTLKNAKGVTEEPRPYNENDAKTKHALLRRWDHKEGKKSEGGLELKEGAAIIQESSSENNWLTLEDGIHIQFQPDATYRTGDYWLIPARTATGDVEWPGLVGNPEPLPPHGVQHHYAPLAIISVDATGTIAIIAELRRRIEPLGEPIP